MDQRRHTIKAYFTVIDKVTTSLIAFFLNEFFQCFMSWFYRKKEFPSHKQSVFQYYKFIRTCVLFAILLSYNCIHFKSSKAKRKKKRRVLVYIFVRENSDIYRQTGLIVGRLELNA